MTASKRPALAAITMSPRGGGIAAVSRMLERALREAYGPECPTITLAGDGRDGTFETGTARRLAFGAELAALQAAGQCDWLLFSHLGLAAVQRHVPRVVRRPYAVFLHDVEAWTPLTGARQRALAGAALRLANSDYTARRVQAANPAAGPVIPCPLALPPDVMTARQPDPRMSLGRHVVLIVGRMVGSERYKGHDQLIDVWPRVLVSVPDAQLVCVGEGDDTERLRDKAARLGIGASVVFTGFVLNEERAALYARAAVFAMPSAREGFGLVYLEAMAAGVPCIGSRQDAAGDVIDHGVTGYLVDRESPEALAVRLIELLCNADLRRRLGDAGRRRLEERFTYKAFARRLIDQLEGVPAFARASASATLAASSR